MENFNCQQNYQSFLGFVQNGRVCNSYGTPIGYTNDEYEKLLNTAKAFEKKLIEAGIIKKPKTAEEINQELQEALKQTKDMMAEMSNTILSLNEKVNNLEDKNVRQTINPESGRKILTTRKDASA